MGKKRKKEQTNKQKHRITLARENHSESMTTIFITDKIYPSFDINESNKEFQTGLQKTFAPKIFF